MSLYCPADSDSDDIAWYWMEPSDEALLNTKRARRCCSCRAKIAVGETARRIERFRPPTEFEEKIYGDEVPLAPWYFCERCGDLADSISEQGLCYDLGENLQDQIDEYRRETP